MRSLLGFSFGAIIVATAVCGAQSSGDYAARAALVLTPVGALPPIATSTIEGEVQRGVALALRYGYLPGSLDGSSINNGGVTAVLPLSTGATFSVTGGFFSPNCRDCDPGLMLGVGGDVRLTEMPFGNGRDGSRLLFALNGDLGYARPRNATFDDGSLVSGSIGVPIALISGGRPRDAMRIVPFITPGFGFGGIRSSDRSTIVFPNGVVRVRNDELSGTRFMIGGGLGVYNRTSTVALNLGFQYVSIPNSDAQIGLGLTLGGR